MVAIRTIKKRTSMEIVGTTGVTYPVELVCCSGTKVEWRYFFRIYRFIRTQHGHFAMEAMSVRLPDDLYESLLALSEQIMKAAFAGYKKKVVTQHLRSHESQPRLL